jgi:hypothetical protein
MSFRLKRIRFLGRDVKILCQNENGPCPLLAICNGLVLRNQLQIHSDYSEVNNDYLIQLVANRIIETNPMVRLLNGLTFYLLTGCWMLCSPRMKTWLQTSGRQ